MKWKLLLTHKERGSSSPQEHPSIILKKIFSSDLPQRHKLFSWGSNTAQSASVYQCNSISFEALKQLRLLLTHKPIVWVHEFTRCGGLSILSQVLILVYDIYYYVDGTLKPAGTHKMKQQSLETELLAIFRAFLNNTVHCWM